MGLVLPGILILIDEIEQDESVAGKVNDVVRNAGRMVEIRLEVALREQQARNSCRVARLKLSLSEHEQTRHIDLSHKF